MLLDRAKNNPTQKIAISDFDSWNPKDYLRDYYSDVEQDEKLTIRFLVEEFKKIKNNPLALEFGIGPTLHHLIPLSPYIREVHVSDFLDKNLEEVYKWKNRTAGSHNWNPFTRLTLKYEGLENPTQEQIDQREDLTRSKISKVFFCDASKDNPIAPIDNKYDLIVSCYCADSATTSREVWYLYMKNIVSLLNPGGLFVSTALRECKYYRVGQRFFPCADVTEEDYRKVFTDLDFDEATVNIMVEEVPEHKDIGYESIILASGFKRI